MHRNLRLKTTRLWPAISMDCSQHKALCKPLLCNNSSNTKFLRPNNLQRMRDTNGHWLQLSQIKR